MLTPLIHNSPPTLGESTAIGRSGSLTPTPASASDMPIGSAVSTVLAPAHHPYDLNRDFHKNRLPQIYNSRQSPSAVTTENFLAARALMTDAFVHDIASTKRDRISDLYNDAPRFQGLLDILV